MLGPLTIMSLDQGKLYGKVTNPELLLWWESPTLMNGEETMESTRPVKRMRQTFLRTMAGLWLRKMQLPDKQDNGPTLKLTGD